MYILYVTDLLTDGNPLAYSDSFATYAEAVEEAECFCLPGDYRIVEFPEEWAPEYFDQYEGI